MKCFFTTSRIFLLSAGILLLASCAASLTDYGYTGGPTSNNYYGSQVNISRGVGTTIFHRSFLDYPNNQEWRSHSEMINDGSGFYSNVDSYSDADKVPHSGKGKVVTEGESLRNYFVFPEHLASYKSNYFKVASEVVFDYDGKTDTFKKCVFFVEAFPSNGNQCYGLDSIVVYNQPRKKMKIEGRLRCEDVPGSNDDIFLDYKIKFNPGKMQSCYTESRVRES